MSTVPLQTSEWVYAKSGTSVHRPVGRSDRAVCGTVLDRQRTMRRRAQGKVGSPCRRCETLSR